MGENITLAEQIKAVESVVKMRRAHHPRAHALMSHLIGAAQLEEAKNRIESENAAMEAALGTLKRLEAWRTQPSPAAPGCKECDYHYYPSTNEDGWRCTSCGHRPGEPAGFSPELDRKRIFFKVGGILHDACDENLIYVSNGTGADLLISAVADRCVEEGRFDQYSILLFLLEETTPSHAKYWGELSESILAGADPRDRCHCGALANIHSGGALYCSWDHMPAERVEMFVSADTNGGGNESTANNGA
jgi:hypothetical protein